MRIKIIQIGKVKDTYLKEGERQFLKRLRPYTKVEILNVKDERNLKIDGFFVALDESGDAKTSKEFAKFLGKCKDSGETITFIIGGPYGLSEDFRNRSDMLLSLSKMTFTHQMVRLFLLEQIYRGVCIIFGKEYHNA